MATRSNVSKAFYASNVRHARAQLRAAAPSQRCPRNPLLLAFLFVIAAFAFAGSASAQSISFIGPFTSYQQTEVGNAQGIVANAAGDLYVSGTSLLGFVPVDANGNPVLSGQVNLNGSAGNVMGMAIDSANNLYRADTSDGIVQKYTLTSGLTGFNGGGGPTSIGSFSKPSGVAVDANFNVYVLDAANGTIYELTPNGGSYTQSNLFQDAGLVNTTGLSMDSAGNFYIASGTAYGVSPIASATVAVYKITNNGGSYSETSLGTGWTSPSSTAVEANGNVWVADYGAGTISVLIPSGGGYLQSVVRNIANIRTLTLNKTGKLYGFAYGAGDAVIWAGGSAPHYLGSYPVGSPAPTVQLTVDFQTGASLAGYSVVTEGNSGLDITDAGGSTCAPATYDVGQTCVINVAFTPQGVGVREGAVVLKGAGGVVLATNYVYGVGLGPVAGFTPATISTVAGTGKFCNAPGTCGDGGPATSATLKTPTQEAFDAAGNLYIADSGEPAIRKVTPAGIISTVAGNGILCSPPGTACGDGGPATSASMNTPSGVALDGAGNIYVIDSILQSIRKVDASTGIISTIAGTGTNCSPATAACGDGGQASLATLDYPSSAAVDGFGNLVFADSFDNRIRSINLGSGVITTVAGTGATCASPTATCGDGGQATTAQLNSPGAVALDAAGDIYISDSNDNRIRMVSAGTGVIATVAGSGSSCSSAPCGDGGAATVAQLSSPSQIALDPAGNLYIDDTDGYSIRVVSAANGSISTIVGNHSQCFSASLSCGDGGSATSAQLISSYGMALDGAGNLYLADNGTNRIREVSVGTGAPLTFATTLIGVQSSDSPQSIAFNNLGNAALTIPSTFTEPAGSPSTINAALNNLGAAELHAEGPPSGSNPSFPAGFSNDSGTTCPVIPPGGPNGTLGAGASCTFAIDFVPAVASTNSGSVVVTDNSLGAASSSQGFTVSGMGLPPVSALGYGTAPATPILVGGNAGTVLVDELSTSSTIVTSATDLITLTVTGPGGYLQTYTSTAVLGVATFSLGGVALPTAGSYTYTATLTGVTSAVATEQVNQLTQAITFTVSSPVTYGVGPITLAATGGASANPVTFSLVSGPATLAGSTLTITGVGNVVVNANQAGNTNYLAAPTVQQTILVLQATPKVVLTSTPNPVFLLTNVTYTATVTGPGVTPTGSVTFYDGAASLGTSTLNASGIATLTAAPTTVGTHTVTAVYAGNILYLTSTSNAVSELAQDFSIAVASGGASTIAVLPGSTATFNLVVTPLGGATFPAAITLTQTGGPTNATVTLAPTSIASGASATNLTLTVVTPNAVIAANHSDSFGRKLAPLSLALLLLPFAFARKRKMWQRYLSLLLLLAGGLAATMGVTGCGTASGYFGQAPTNFTITVTGAAGSLTHSTSVTLTLE